MWVVREPWVWGMGVGVPCEVIGLSLGWSGVVQSLRDSGVAKQTSEIVWGIGLLDGGGGSEVANERGESFEVIEELISELLFIHIESLETELLGLFLKHVASTERIENLGLDEYFLVLDWDGHCVGDHAIFVSGSV